MNQEMETALRCLTSRNPSSRQLLWIETYPVQPPVSRLSGLTNRHSFLSRNVRPASPQSRRSSSIVNALGCRPTPPFCAPPTVTNGPPTDVTSLYPVTLQGSASGYLRGTFPSEWSPRSWLPVSWAHSPSRGSSTLQLSVFVYHGP